MNTISTSNKKSNALDNSETLQLMKMGNPAGFSDFNSEKQPINWLDIERKVKDPLISLASNSKDPDGVIQNYDTALMLNNLGIDMDQATKMAEMSATSAISGIDYEGKEYWDALTATAKNAWWEEMKGTTTSLYRITGNYDFLKYADDYQNKISKNPVLNEYGGFGNLVLSGVQPTMSTLKFVATTALFSWLPAGIALKTGSKALQTMAKGGALTAKGLNFFFAGYSQAGNTLYDVINTKDANGKTLPWDSPMGGVLFHVFAGLTGAVEMGSLEFLPWYKALNNKFTKNELIKHIKQGVVNEVGNFLWEGTKGTVAESIEEGLQHLLSAGFTNALRSMANKNGATFELDSLGNTLKEAVDQTISAGKSMFLTSFLTAGVGQGVYSTKMRLESNKNFTKSKTSISIDPFFVNTPKTEKVNEVGEPSQKEDPSSKDSSTKQKEKQTPIEPIKTVRVEGRLIPTNEAELEKVRTAQERGAKVLEVEVSEETPITGVDQTALAHQAAFATGGKILNENTLVYEDEEQLKFAGHMLSPNIEATTKTEDGYKISLRNEEGTISTLNLSLAQEDMELRDPDIAYAEDVSAPYALSRMKEEQAYKWHERELVKNAIGDIQGHTEGKISSADLEANVDAVILVANTLNIPTDELLQKNVIINLTDKINTPKGDGARGSIEQQVVGGKKRYVITLSKKADVSTLLHELGHTLRGLATAEQLADFKKHYGSEEFETAFLDDIEHVDGKFSVANKKFDTYKEAQEYVEYFEERFADDFVAYLRTGQAPSTELKNIFSRMKAVLSKLIKEFGYRLTPEVQEAFDNLLTGNDGFDTESITDSQGNTLFQGSSFEAVREKYIGTDQWMKAPNGEDTNLNEQQWIAVRTPEFKAWFGDWELLANYQWLMDSSPVKRLTGDEFTRKEGTQLSQQVNDFYASFGREIYREGLGLVKLNIRGVNTSIAHGVSRTKAIAFAAIPDIITHGKVFSELENYKERGYTAIVIAAPIQVADKDYICEVVLNRINNSSNFYLHEVEIKEKLLNFDHQVRAYVTDEQSLRITETGASRLIISKLLAESKFNASKVVDENGEPLVVYHHTENHFTEFRQGKGLSGDGIYFSEYPLAQFGNIQMKVFLNIRNPITRDTEVEGMREINSARIPIKMVDDVLDKFPEFDGVINRSEITVKNSNQIKSATGNIGTYDAHNPNILFQGAYHGTGNSFDRFNPEFIGDGEGAQAYGWGFYLSSNFDVSNNYRIISGYDNGSQTINGKEITSEYDRIDRLAAKTKDSNWLYSVLEGIEMLMMHDTREMVLERLRESEADERAIQYFKDANYKTFGNVYNTEFSDDLNILEYYEKLSENDYTNLIASLEALGIEQENEGYIDDLVDSLSPDMNAGTIYGIISGAMEDNLDNKKATSEFFDSIGINGFSYPAKDQSGSESSTDVNYVIFNPDNIKIESPVLFQTAPPVGSDEFNKNLGNTKVVDPDGNPLLVYHGTPFDFTDFLPEKINSNLGAGMSRGAIWFSSATEMAMDYTNYFKNPEYIKFMEPINNQFKDLYNRYPIKEWDSPEFKREYKNLKAKESRWRKKAPHGSKIVSAYLNMERPYEISTTDRSWKNLDDAYVSAQFGGYDGLIVHDIADTPFPNGIKATVYAAFSNNQIFIKERMDAYTPKGVALFQEKLNEDPRVSVRVPWGKNADITYSDPGATGLDTVIKAGKDEQFAKTLESFTKLKRMSGETAEKYLNRVIDWMSDNLIAIYNSIPAKDREFAKVWYDGAHLIATQMGQRVRKNTKSMAAVIAVMSPGKDWNQNLSMAARLTDIMYAMEDQELDESSLSWLIRYLNEKGSDLSIVDKIRGRKLSELTNEEAAYYVRAYDEAHNTRAFRIALPNGTFSGYSTTKSGNKSSMVWQSFRSIEKAVSTYRNDSLKNISKELGREHKVRSFYNNIVMPWSGRGENTIDTHATAGAFLRPLGTSSPEVNAVFGGVGSGSNADKGLSGLSPILQDAMRRAASQVGILPREMQSITWVGAMNMFDNKKNKKYNDIAIEKWETENGREQIINEFRYRPSGNENVAQQESSIYEGELSRDVDIRSGWRGIRDNEESSRNLSSITRRSQESIREAVLYQLSPQAKQQLLDIRKDEVKTAVENFFYIPQDVLEEYAGEEWADDEIAFRAHLKDNPSLLEEAKNYSDTDEFLEYIKANIELGSYEWALNDDQWFKRIHAYARIQDPKDKDAQFVRLNTGTDKALIALGKDLRGYEDVDTRGNPNNRRNYDGRFVRYHWGSFKGVSTKVKRLSADSTAEELQEARALITANPRPYRKAMQVVDGARERVQEMKGYISSSDAGRDAYYDALGEELEEALNEPVLLNGMTNRQAAEYLRTSTDKRERYNAREKLSTHAGVYAMEQQANAELKKLGVEKDSDIKKLENQLRTAQADRNLYAKELKEEKKKYSEARQLGNSLGKALEERRARVKDLRTQLTEANENVRSLTNKVTTLKNRIETRALKEKLEKLHKKILATVVFNSDSIDASFEEVFNAIHSLFEQDQRPGEFKPLPQQMSQYIVEEQLRWVQQGKKITQWSLGDLEVLYEAAQLMRADAKVMLEQKKVERMNKLQNISAQMYKQQYGSMPEMGVGYGSIMNDIIDDLTTNRDTYDENIFNAIFNTVRSSIGKMQRISRMLDGNKEGVAYQLFVREAYEKMTEELRESYRRLTEADERMKELKITSDLLAKDSFGYTTTSGQKKTLSKGEVIGLYVYSQNELGTQKLVHNRGNNISPLDLAKAIGSLTEDEKAWGDYMLDNLGGDEVWERMNKTYVDVYNRNLGRRQRYFTFVADGKVDEGKTDLLVGPQGSKIRYVDKDFTKVVNPHAIYPLKLNVTHTFTSQVKKQEHFVQWASWVRDMNYLLTKGAVGRIIEMNYGPKFMNTVQEYVNDVGSPQVILDDIERIGSKIISNAAVAALSLNFLTMLKQLPSFSAALRGDVGAVELTNVALRLSNPKTHAETVKFIHEMSPYMLKRSISIEVEKYNASDFDSFLGRKVQAFNENIGMKGIQMMDQAAVNTLWLASYDTYLRRNPQKLSGEALKKEAAFRATQLISETQPTSIANDLSSLQRKKNPWVRTALLFSNQLFQYVNMVWYDLPTSAKAYMATKDPKELRKLFGIVTNMAISGAMIMLVSGVAFRKDGEDDDSYWERIRNEMMKMIASYSLPVIGGDVGQGISGWSYGGDLVDLPSSFGRMLGADWTDLDKISDRAWDVLDGAGSIGGLPTAFINRVIKSVKTENPFEMFGSSYGDLWEKWYE